MAKIFGECQVCARQIAIIPGGIIAHHGYTRPGNGWQTASCFGAQNEPWASSRNALQEYISFLHLSLEAGKRQEALLKADAPTLILQEIVSGTKTIMVSKDTCFSWDKILSKHIARQASSNKALSLHIKEMEKRYASWEQTASSEANLQDVESIL